MRHDPDQSKDRRIMQLRTRFILAIGVGVLACLPMQAQSYGHSPASQAANDPTRNDVLQNGENPDAIFMRNTAEANLAEVAAAQIAQAKSKDEDVKNFAQHMIDDHTAMQND